MGKRLPSTTPSMVLRLRGHCVMGPSGVLDQSVERTSRPISPPLVAQCASYASSSTVGCEVSLVIVRSVRLLVCSGWSDVTRLHKLLINRELFHKPWLVNAR